MSGRILISLTELAHNYKEKLEDEASAIKYALSKFYSKAFQLNFREYSMLVTLTKNLNITDKEIWLTLAKTFATHIKSRELTNSSLLTTVKTQENFVHVFNMLY